MKKDTLKIAVVALVAALVGGMTSGGVKSLFASGHASATAAIFTIPYQGRLESNGSPVTAGVDMKFMLSEIGNPQNTYTATKTGVPVKNGYFSVDLDNVTPAVAQAREVKIETEIRPPGSSSWIRLTGSQTLYPALSTYRADLADQAKAATSGTFTVPTGIAFGSGASPAKISATNTLDVRTGESITFGIDSTTNHMELKKDLFGDPSLKLDVDTVELGSATLSREMSGKYSQLTGYVVNDHEFTHKSNISTDEGFCFLTGVRQYEDGDADGHGSCTLKIVADKWELITWAGNASRMECNATCIKW